MKLGSKVISLSLAKRIHEAAKEAGVVLPKSEYVWIHHTYATFEQAPKLKAGWSLRSGNSLKVMNPNLLSAFDIAELGEMLGKRMLETYRNAGKIILNSIDCPQFAEENEAESRGKMYLYLLKNKLIK